MELQPKKNTSMKQTIGNYNVRRVTLIETSDTVYNVEHLMVYNISNLSDTIEFNMVIEPQGKVFVMAENTVPQSFVNKSLKDLQEFIVGEYKNSLVESN